MTESPDRESSSRADEYTRNFLQREALPTIWQELAFHRRFIPGVTLAESTRWPRDWFPEQNRLVVVMAPEGAAACCRSGAAGRRRAAASARPWRRTSSRRGSEAHGHVARRAAASSKAWSETDGITEWTLSNGATVVLQPTTLKADQILFRATAPGGTSLASDADFSAARVADDVVPAGGVGTLSAPWRSTSC